MHLETGSLVGTSCTLRQPQSVSRLPGAVRLNIVTPALQAEAERLQHLGQEVNRGKSGSKPSLRGFWVFPTTSHRCPHRAGPQNRMSHF